MSLFMPLKTCECMGASVSSIHGFNKALGQDSEGKTVAVHRGLHVYALRHDGTGQHRL